MVECTFRDFLFIAIPEARYEKKDLKRFQAIKKAANAAFFIAWNICSLNTA